MHRSIAVWLSLSIALLSGGCSLAVGEGNADSESAALQSARLPIVSDFSDCVESIGVEVIPTQAVRPRVPAGFTLVGESAPVTPVVVRTANCGSLALSLAFPEAEAQTDADSAASRLLRPISILQVGALIVPPDGSGDVNIYSISYSTNNLRLLAALRYAGVQAEGAVVDYGYTPATGRLDVVLVSLQNRLTLRGTVGALTAAPVPFVSNWWVATNQGVVKLSTTVPALVISNADLSLQTTAGSALTGLLGTNTSFSALEQFNGFASAQLRF